MTDFSSRQFPILFGDGGTTTGLADAIQKIDEIALCREYEELRKAVPSRSARNLRYFVDGHNGCPQAKDRNNVSEKHLAIALWHLKAQWPRPGPGWMRLLDYEVPLRASNSDAGLGEVDLLGVTDQGRLVVVELKVKRKSDRRGDTPLLALKEGLRYAAVVHVNHYAIAAEANERFAIDVSDQPPIVQILAPDDWWSAWCDMVPRTRRVAGQWERSFLQLSDRLEARLGIIIECASLQETKPDDIIWEACGPRLSRTPSMRWGCLDRLSTAH